MRFSVILRYIGTVMLCVAAFMAVAAGISYMDNDSGYYPLLLSSLLTLLLGAFPMLFVQKAETISNKEGFSIVVGSWILACVVGMFPYLIWGGEFSLIDAWFESVSGFTTTGATILDNVEALPQGLLFWRSSTCWIGGAGVVMFALVILPSMGTNKMALSSVELSSLAKDNYRYRTQIIVRILLMVYVGLTLLTTVLLRVAGMRWFDALNHAMSACATGGFSTKNASIGYFDNPIIEIILIVAMLLASIHFGLIYATFTRKANNMFRSEVVRTYGIVIAIGALSIALSIYLAGLYPTFGQAVRESVFQFVSIISTTGFATTDTNLWTPFAIMILIVASIVCACAGSTSGGLKIDRLLLFVKVFFARLRLQRHPNAVVRIRVDGIVQEESQLDAVMVFIVSYLCFMLIGTLFNTMFGLDMMTAFSSAAACIGNVGPGFGEVGSLDTYSQLPAVLKLQDTLLMLMGRLEIFGFIQLLFIKWLR